MSLSKHNIEYVHDTVSHKVAVKVDGKLLVDSYGIIRSFGSVKDCDYWLTHNKRSPIKE